MAGTRNFKLAVQRQQARFRKTSPTVSQQGRQPGLHHDYLLALGCEGENLYPSLRGDDGVRKFFGERGIKWWRWLHRKSPNSDTFDGDGPTRNMTSSQVACVNFLMPLAGIDGALDAAIRAVDSDVKDVINICHNGRTSSVEFEWIGCKESLEGGTDRGAQNTSVDAFVVVSTEKGLRRAYLMEWKYAESYGRDYKGKGDKGRERRRRYSSLYSAKSSAFKDAIPMDELFYDPFYQLMRLRLLADRIVQERELGASEAKVVAVVPEGNTAYRNQITSPGLKTRFPAAKTVEAAMRAVLKCPSEAFAVVSQDMLADAVRKQCGGAVSAWSEYQRERYGW